VDVSGLQTALDSKQPSGNYANASHTHTSSNITDFNSAVSGLIPVKGLTAGYDISISNASGNYSIASTNLVHVDGKQPHGFVNRTDSIISLSGNVFTIAPTGASYAVYNNGLKVIKTTPESITIPSGITQINYIHFNVDTTTIDNKTTGFDFTTDLPIAFISWNGSISPSGQMTFFAEERHGINMDARTQQWIHYTFGAQYISGLSIGNYVLGGNGSSNSHATFGISNGTLYQEDIQIDITDTTDVNLPFGQELNPIAQIPIYYHEGNTGQWVKSIPNDYALTYGANGPKYNLLSGGSWTVENVHNGSQTRYFAVWILATNQIDNPIISILGQRVDSTLNAAENNNNWSDINLTNLPLNEVQILYRLIFAGDADYTNTPKARLMSILDLRTASIVNTVGTPQNDHGSLFGLGDDDHYQYVHIDNARTISAIHTLTNGITFDGSGTQTVPYLPSQVNITGGSGNFSSLKLNSTTVSVSGHTHSISDISSLQTTLDSKQASGNYQPSGNYALSNHQHLISDVSGLQTSLDGKQASGNYAPLSHTHTSSQITDFATSVSGLLPITNLIAGSNITISSNSGNITISASGGSIPDPYDLGTYPLINISSQPSGTSVAENQNATFSINASASSPSSTILYQWQLSTNSGSSWSNINGATSSSLTISNVQSSWNGYQYRCLLSANLSSATSSSATLTVSGYTPAAVVLSTGTSYSVPAGATTMKVWGIGGGAAGASEDDRYGGSAAVVYKTWSVSGGQTITMSIAVGFNQGSSWDQNGQSTTVTFSGSTITAGGARSPYNNGTTVRASFSGGDGGAQGALGGLGIANGRGLNNDAGSTPNDVSGLLTAVSLAVQQGSVPSGVTTSNFGYGITVANRGNLPYGGGGQAGGGDSGGDRTSAGSVVLYFT
jgi:hypothetical protein